MQAYLKKHGSGVALHTVKVEWELTPDGVVINFTTNKRSGRPWLSDEVFTSDWSKNWGLWNKDVLEAFIQMRKTPEDTTAPYLEIQVSPLNQPFALIITEPRKSFHPPKSLDFKHQVEVEGRSFKARMEIKFPSELKGDLVYGGFFACLDHDPREYFAVNPNDEVAPDFHRPDLFLPLGES